jgi:hypothetical protein
MDIEEDRDIDHFFSEEKDENELSESYIIEKFYDKTYECVSESLLYIQDYTYEHSLPIGEKLTFSDLYDFFFEE